MKLRFLLRNRETLCTSGQIVHHLIFAQHQSKGRNLYTRYHYSHHTGCVSRCLVPMFAERQATFGG